MEERDYAIKRGIHGAFADWIGYGVFDPDAVRILSALPETAGVASVDTILSVMGEMADKGLLHNTGLGRYYSYPQPSDEFARQVIFDLLGRDLWTRAVRAAAHIGERYEGVFLSAIKQLHYAGATDRQYGVLIGVFEATSRIGYESKADAKREDKILEEWERKSEETQRFLDRYYPDHRPRCEVVCTPPGEKVVREIEAMEKTPPSHPTPEDSYGLFWAIVVGVIFTTSVIYLAG